METVRLDVRDAVATLTLNRPEKLNCFTERMHAELRMALDSVEGRLDGEAAVRVLVLTGAGRAFCAGQDLSERRTAEGAPPPDLGASLASNYNPLICRIAELPIPVIAAVNGIASGSGANLALACDLVIAARSASFVQPFVRLGLIPDAGGTWTLPRLVGPARAKGLAFLGEPVPAERAMQWGMIWEAVDDGALMGRVQEVAGRLACLPRGSFASQKRAFAASGQNDLAAQLELEARLQAQAGRSDDYRNGVARFFKPSS